MHNNNCIEEDCKKWVHSELTSIYQDLEQRASEENQKQGLTQLLNHCQSVYNMDIRSAEQAKLYEQNLDKYKSRFLNKALIGYSDISRQYYEAYMNTLNFKISTTEKQNITKSFVVFAEARKRHYRSPSDIGAYINQGRSAYLNLENAMCPSSRNMEPYDAFSGSDIRVSAFSCQFHEHGKQILAHELGHALSYWFSKHRDKKNKPSTKSYNQFMRLRQCANERYKNDNTFIKQRVFNHDNDKFRTEEDMADLIAYQVFQSEPTLLSCSMGLELSKDGSKYKTLKVLYPPPSNSKKDKDLDPHSTGFLRAIMEAIYKRKKLSSACQKIMDTYKDEINFEPCF